VAAGLESGNLSAWVSLGGALPLVWLLGGGRWSLFRTKRDDIIAQPPSGAVVVGVAPVNAYLATTVECGRIYVSLLVGGLMRLCGLRLVLCGCWGAKIGRCRLPWDGRPSNDAPDFRAPVSMSWCVCRACGCARVLS